MKLKIKNSNLQKLYHEGGVLGSPSKIKDLGANKRSQEPTCSLCPIEFPSMKSSVLVSDKSGSSCSSMNSSVEELIESKVSIIEPPLLHSKWSNTDERPSGRSKSCTINNEVDYKRKLEEEEEQQQQQQQSNIKKNEIRNVADYDSDDAYWLGLDQDVEKKQWSVDDQNVNPHDFIGTHQQGGHSNNVHDDYYISGSKRKRMSTTSKKNKDSKQKQEGCNFGCSICGRTFPTFQALGGHKSSHNKDKKINPTAISAGAGFGTGATRVGRVANEVPLLQELQ